MPNDQEVGDSRWSGYVKYEDELAQKACNERWTKSISRQMATFNVRILSILTIQSTTKATIKNRRKGKVEITGKAMKCTMRTIMMMMALTDWGDGLRVWDMSG
jgi:hypothetical protein